MIEVITTTEKGIEVMTEEAMTIAEVETEIEVMIEEAEVEIEVILTVSISLLYCN